MTAPVLRGTNQLIRYPLMNIASEHEVPAAVVEKPICGDGRRLASTERIMSEYQDQIRGEHAAQFSSAESEIKS